jgi:hypothetical protein
MIIEMIRIFGVGYGREKRIRMDSILWMVDTNEIYLDLPESRR